MTRKLTAGIAIGFAAALAAWVCDTAGWLEAPKHIAWDARQQLTAQPATEQVPIRLILLDEQSLTWGRSGVELTWPWPLEVYAPIIRFCRLAGAKAIVFDVQFNDFDRFSPLDDRRLAEVAGQFPDFVAAVVPGHEADAQTRWPKDLGQPGTRVAELEGYLKNTNAKGITAESVRFPIPPLAQSAAVLGHILHDGDATARHIIPVIRFDETDIPALGLAAYLAGREADPEAGGARLLIEQRNLRVDSHSIPLGGDGRALLRFREPTEAENGHLYPAYSAAAVIQSYLSMASGDTPKIDPAELKDCYVFFGFSAPALHDNVRTPVTELSPGVEVHATFLDNLLSGGFLRDASGAAVFLFMLLWSIAAAVAVGKTVKALKLAAVYAVALPMPAVLGLLLFRGGIAWPVVAPTLAAGAALIGATVLSLSTEGRQRRFIRRAFGHYLSPAVIERVLADPSQLRLGGERREVTVMFIDLAGFTSIAEKLDAQVLSKRLNDYLTLMSEAILEEEGTLDKYQGDAVMAFWNAPLDQPDHALRACRAALLCLKRISDLGPSWRESTGCEPRIRIGIHTGPCVVGNMGSRQRFDYTVLGDTANLASRLEGVNKVFGTSALVSESTWSHLQDAIAGRAIGRVRVTGRAEPVGVFEPVSLGEAPDGQAHEAFRQALDHCAAGKLTEALNLFDQITDDPVAKAYACKLAQIGQSQNPSWDNVWDITHK